MRERGLLDRFPIHLLFNSGQQASILVLDSPDLGRLRLVPVGSLETRVLVASPEYNILANSRRTLEGHGMDCVQFVRVDPDQLPFSEASFDVVVVPETRGFPASVEGVRKLVKENGRVILIEDMGRVRKSMRATSQEEKDVRSYFVRPASGRTYWTTDRWLPRMWPFRSVQIGLVQSLSLKLNLLLSVLRIPMLQDGVRITVQTNVPIDSWFRVPDTLSTSGSKPVGIVPESARCLGLFVKPDEQAFLFDHTGPDQCGSGTVVKFPLSEVTLRAMDVSLDNIDQLHTLAGPEIVGVLPEIVDRGRIAGQAYWRESMCEGVPATKHTWKPGWRRTAVEIGAAFIQELHMQTSEAVKISDELLADLLEPHLTAIERKVRLIDPEFSMQLFHDRICQGMGQRGISMVRSHGDFWQGNILLTKEGDLSAVLDWDESVQPGWPLLDLLHLIAHQHKRHAYCHFGRVVTGKFMSRRFWAWESKLITAYSHSLGISDESWSCLVALYWLNRVSFWARKDHGNPDVLSDTDAQWIRRNIVRPLPNIVGQL